MLVKIEAAYINTKLNPADHWSRLGKDLSKSPKLSREGVDVDGLLIG